MLAIFCLDSCFLRDPCAFGLMATWSSCAAEIYFDCGAHGETSLAGEICSSSDFAFHDFEPQQGNFLYDVAATCSWGAFLVPTSLANLGSYLAALNDLLSSDDQLDSGNG